MSSDSVYQSLLDRIAALEAKVAKLESDRETKDDMKNIRFADNGITVVATKPLAFYIKNGQYQILKGKTYYVVADRGELRDVLAGKIKGISPSNIVTTFITNMSGLFRGESPDVNQPIGWRSASSAANISRFNQDISTWDTSGVTDMSYMFNKSMFNRDISAWDTSRVTHMRGMFWRSRFNRDITGWDTSRVTDMAYMFTFSKFDQDIGGWDTSKVTNMHRMFAHSEFNQDISGWDTSKVMDMMEMFRQAQYFRKALYGWKEAGPRDRKDDGMFYMLLTKIPARTYLMSKPIRYSPAPAPVPSAPPASSSFSEEATGGGKPVDPEELPIII